MLFARHAPCPAKQLGALLALALVVFVAGCGGGVRTTQAALKLEREDLAAMARALSAVQAPVAREVAATKASWPLIANGVPADVRSIAGSPAVARAAASATILRVPALLGEAQLRTLTGPASQIGGVFRSYALLSARGWKLLLASIEGIESGSPAVARFARANSALYIESIYDAHFTLAQIGKKLRAGYKKLGGASAFGDQLTPALLDVLAGAYSEASDRLHPHVGVRLGS